MLLLPVARAEEGRFVTTLNNMSCARWITVRKAEENRSEDYVIRRLPVFLATHWALGYLTARNLTGDTKVDFLADIEQDTVKAWIDKYCAGRDGKKLSDALDALVEEIARRAK